MPYFHHDGIRFCFEERGEGRPLVFSHGLGGSLEQALELIGEIPGIRLIAYDNRAHGRTAPLGEVAKLIFTRMAMDMAALLDYMGISTAFIGGVSMGAGIAMAFGRKFPQRTLALVLSRPAWLNSPNPPNLLAFPTIASLVEQHGLEGGLRELEKTDLYKGFRDAYPETAKSLLGIFSGRSSEALVAAFRSLPASTPFSSFDELRDLKISALVLGNRNDPIHPFEFATAWAGGLPCARLHEFPSKSEDLQQHQIQFRGLLTDFLEGMP